MIKSNYFNTDVEYQTWEINKKIEEAEAMQYEYKEMIEKVDAWENESYMQVNRSKRLNDELLNLNANLTDSKVRNLLIKREEILEKRYSLEQCFFSEYRESLNEKITETDGKMEEYLEKLKIIQKNQIDN